MAGTKIAYSTGCILKIQTLFYVAVNKLALNKDGGRTLHLHDKYIIIIQLYQSCHIILCFCSTVMLIICIFLASDEKNTFVITPLVLSKLCDSHEKSKSQCSLLCSRSFSILVNWMEKYYNKHSRTEKYNYTSQAAFDSSVTLPIYYKSYNLTSVFVILSIPYIIV